MLSPVSCSDTLDRPVAIPVVHVWCPTWIAFCSNTFRRAKRTPDGRTTGATGELHVRIHPANECRLCLAETLAVGAAPIARPPLLHLIVFPATHTADLVAPQRTFEHQKSATRTGMR